jgi:hypothetical protein
MEWSSCFIPGIFIPRFRNDQVKILITPLASGQYHLQKIVGKGTGWKGDRFIFGYSVATSVRPAIGRSRFLGRSPSFTECLSNNP